jgi:hypothetical protein
MRKWKRMDEVRDMSGMTPSDYQQAATQSAQAKGDTNSEQIKSLKLQVQQLRQCIVNMLMYLRLNPLPEVTCDHWWEELTSYPRVEND